MNGISHMRNARSFLDLVRKRFSVRSFRPEPVPAECIGLILEAANVAPTACNRQPQRILAVNSKDGLKRLKKCTDCHFDAPLAFIVCCDLSECWEHPFDGKKSSDVASSIVATHMMLEAADLRIGSTRVMFFKPDAVKAEFALSEAVEPVAILVMGYPADGCTTSQQHDKRKEISETVTFR